MRYINDYFILTLLLLYHTRTWCTDNTKIISNMCSFWSYTRVVNFFRWKNFTVQCRVLQKYSILPSLYDECVRFYLYTNTWKKDQGRILIRLMRIRCWMMCISSVQNVPGISSEEGNWAIFVLPIKHVTIGSWKDYYSLLRPQTSDFRLHVALKVFIKRAVWCLKHWQDWSTGRRHNTKLKIFRASQRTQRFVLSGLQSFLRHPMLFQFLLLHDQQILWKGLHHLPTLPNTFATWCAPTVTKTKKNRL